MDQATQQNSALVEENAATAKTLESQAVAMNERVSFFQIDDRAIAPPTPQRAAQPPQPTAEKPKPARAHAPIQRPTPRGGAVAKMQAAVATAFQDEEWKEF
jgi:hypothetical protein